MKLSKFDLVKALLVLAGKLQARRVRKAKATEAAFKFAIQSATEGLQEATKARVAVEKTDLSVVVK